MLHLIFTEEDIEELHFQRYHHPHPRVQMKMEALLLKAKGLPHHHIARLAWVSVKTPCGPTSSNIRLAALKRSKSCQFHHPTSELEAHRDTIEASFHEHPATSIPEAVKRIEELTGIKRSPTQVGVFLKHLGLKRLKTSAIPAKCDVEEQASFKQTNWSPV